MRKDLNPGLQVAGIINKKEHDLKSGGRREKHPALRYEGVGNA